MWEGVISDVTARSSSEDAQEVCFLAFIYTIISAGLAVHDHGVFIRCIVLLYIELSVGEYKQRGVVVFGLSLTYVYDIFFYTSVKGVDFL